MATAHRGALAAAVLALALPAAADDDADAKNSRFEFKRQNTGRGTESESTKTTLRFEVTPEAGAFSQWRIDIPLPDAKSDFAGDPFDPRLGDVKLRTSLRATIDIGGVPWIPYVELTLPTADPGDLGSGKFQIQPGLRTNVPWMTLHPASGPHKLIWGSLVQQVVSFGGDPNRKDINYTKLELSVRDNWGHGHSVKATLKPNIDWIQDGKTGGVLEIEGSTGIGRDWRVQLMGGHLAWGAGVQGTYSKRLELTLAKSF